MANFLKSLFFGETDESEETKLNRNFDVLKYDGIKALKIGKNTYAIRYSNIWSGPITAKIGWKKR